MPIQIGLDVLVAAIEQALAHQKPIRYRSGTGAQETLASVRASHDGTFLVLTSTVDTRTACQPASNRWNSLVAQVRDYLSVGK